MEQRIPGPEIDFSPKIKRPHVLVKTISNDLDSRGITDLFEGQCHEKIIDILSLSTHAFFKALTIDRYLAFNKNPLTDFWISLRFLSKYAKNRTTNPPNVERRLPQNYWRKTTKLEKKFWQGTVNIFILEKRSESEK